ncbi:MAG: hypothetical protein ABEJ68_09620 [Halobacteriaceae archaeon]
MAREVRLNNLDGVLAELDYPVSHGAAAAELSDVTLVYADGTENLSKVFDRIEDDSFADADDLRGSVFGALPTEAVGEPGQSEGEG